MNTVLVVEDEKQIRQGIAAMVHASPVEVRRVVECKNGLEALEQLRGGDEIDLVITDLRMGRMDGVELVEHINEMPQPPFVIVVSGYDEFDYAVSMLRMGVRDYLLKPVDRNKFYQILQRLEAECRQREDIQRIQQSAALQLIRSMLSGQSPPQQALQSAIRMFEESIFSKSYVMVCMRTADQPEPLPPQVLSLGEINQQAFLLILEEHIGVFQMPQQTDRCAGFSTRQQGFQSLQTAFAEAEYARQQAFVSGRTMIFGEIGPQLAAASMEREAEQIAQLAGTGNAGEAKGILQETLFQAQNGQLAPSGFPTLAVELVHRLIDTYSMEPGEKAALEELAKPFSFHNAYALYEGLCLWLDGFCLKYQDEEDNAKRIHLAIQFLHDNFTRQIDMAVVSNHVSMNYSQFSVLFKRYTNTNFQDYLRDLRIEESKRLLRETDLSIHAVSEQSGFKNDKHFMKVFKLSVAVSPSEYRRNCRGKQGRDTETKE